MWYSWGEMCNYVNGTKRIPSLDLHFNGPLVLKNSCQRYSMGKESFLLNDSWITAYAHGNACGKNRLWLIPHIIQKLI